MKQIAFLKAAGPAATLHSILLDRLGARGLRGSSQLTVNLVTDGDADTPWDAVLEIWTDGSATSTFPWDEIPGNLSRRAVYIVDELVGKDSGLERGWPTPGVKLMVPWIGRSDVPQAEQGRHWDEHVPLANRVHVGVVRYVRNWIENSDQGGVAGQPPYRGIACQHYLTEHDLMHRSFDRPESVQVITDDVADFIAEHFVLRVTEYFRTGGVGNAV